MSIKREKVVINRTNHNSGKVSTTMHSLKPYVYGSKYISLASSMVAVTLKAIILITNNINYRYHMFKKYFAIAFQFSQEGKSDNQITK